MLSARSTGDNVACVPNQLALAISPRRSRPRRGRRQTTEKVVAKTAAEGPGGDGIQWVYPRERIAVMARPGNVVHLEACHKSNCGVILHCMDEGCVVRGTAGELVALTWGEVILADVQPDPAFISRPGAESRPSNPSLRIAVG